MINGQPLKWIKKESLIKKISSCFKNKPANKTIYQYSWVCMSWTQCSYLLKIYSSWLLSKEGWTNKEQITLISNAVKPQKVTVKTLFFICLRIYRLVLKIYSILPKRMIYPKFLSPIQPIYWHFYKSREDRKKSGQR